MRPMMNFKCIKRPHPCNRSPRGLVSSDHGTRMNQPWPSLRREPHYSEVVRVQHVLLLKPEAGFCVFLFVVAEPTARAASIVQRKLPA